MKKSLFLGFLVLVLVALPLLSACGEDDTTSTSSSSSSTSTSTTPTSINVALAGTAPTTLDPALGGSGGAGGYAGTNNVFETLISFDADNQIMLVLADSYEYNEDGTVLEVKLKEGVLFSSGDPFTSEDFLFSLDREAELNSGIMDQISQNYDHAEAVDDYTVKFYFPEPNVQFLPQTLGLIWISSKAYYDRVGEEAFLDNPPGTGPYKFAEWVEGQYIDLVANEYYRGTAPQIEEAHFVFVSDGATRISMLEAGEVDMITETTFQSVATLEAEGYNRIDLVQPHAIAVQFDLLNPDAPWADLRVRQAINYALDKDVIINQIMLGIVQEVAWQLPWELGYDASLEPSYAYNLEEARDLMEEAGYGDGFEMELVYRSDTSWATDLVDYAVSALEQLNITCTLNGLAGMPTFMSYITRELYPDHSRSAVILSSCGWPGQAEPVMSLTNGFYSIKPNTLFEDAEIDALVAQALATIDRTERGEIVKEAYQKINDLLPFIPLCIDVYVTMTTSNITYTPSITGMYGLPTNLIDITIQ